MCDPASLALMAVGKVVSHVAEKNAQKARDRAIASGEQRQQEYRQRATAAVNRASESYKPQPRAERQAQIEAEATQGFEGDIERARVQGEGTLGERIQGKVSSDYDVERAQAVRDVIAKAARTAQLLGKVTAPQRLREAEGFDRGDLGTQLGQLGSFAQGQYGVDRLRIAEADRPNPALMLLGDAASAAGRGMASGGGGSSSAGLQAPPGTYVDPTSIRGRVIAGQALR